MGMKQRFTADEWAAVQTVPIQAFVFVAGADGKVDKKELEAFTSRMTQDAVADPDPLMRELALDIMIDVDPVLRRAQSTSPSAVKQILHAQLTAEEYQSFVGSVFADALHVAGSSGGRWRKKKKFGDKETQHLTQFAAIWDLDPQAFLRNFMTGSPS